MNNSIQPRNFNSSDHYNVSTYLLLEPSNSTSKATYINKKELEYLINTNSYFIQENIIRIIFDSIINNFKLYANIWVHNIDFTYWSAAEFESEKTRNTLYINSIDDLLNIRKSDELFLCCLNDILFKLKLNTEIIITEIKNYSIYVEKKDFKPYINNKTKHIKIGYIDDESKLYNKNLNIYKNEIYNIIAMIQDSVSFFNNNNNIFIPINTFNSEIKKKLYDAIVSL